jgi:cleavage stimulation factor subunit 2
MSGPEAISLLLNTFSPSKKLQIITDLKSLINSNTGVAVELLRACPQLAFAVVQSMLALGLVEPSQIANIVEQPNVRDSTPQPVPHPVSAPLPPIPQRQNYSQQQAPPQQASNFAQPDAQQAALIKQVMLLTDEQVNELPADQREAISLLRQRVRNGEIKI